jgi:acyl-CoA synthetase (AMP-forming)/AMP-acid ligase II
LRRVVFLGAEKKHDWLLWQELSVFASISDETLAAHQVELTFEDPINIQYTSGTTGFPKGVVLTHHNLVNNALFIASSMNLSERDRICIPVSFYHCFGMVLGNLTAVLAGATMVIPSATLMRPMHAPRGRTRTMHSPDTAFFHVYRRTGTPGVCLIRSGHFAYRHHGWLTLSD